MAGKLEMEFRKPIVNDIKFEYGVMSYKDIKIMLDYEKEKSSSLVRLLRKDGYKYDLSCFINRDL